VLRFSFETVPAVVTTSPGTSADTACYRLPADPYLGNERGIARRTGNLRKSCDYEDDATSGIHTIRGSARKYHGEHTSEYLRVT